MSLSTRPSVIIRPRNYLLAPRNLLVLILLIVAAVFGWQWFTVNRVDKRRERAIEKTTLLHPNWRLESQLREYVS